jgi:hypothetical protein
MAQANYQNLGKRAPGKISGTVNSYKKKMKKKGHH